MEIDNDNFDINDYLEDDDRNQIDVEGDQTISPAINAFIKDQSDQALNFTPIDDGSDTFAPRICSYQIQDNIHLQGNNNESTHQENDIQQLVDFIPVIHDISDAFRQGSMPLHNGIYAQVENMAESGNIDSQSSSTMSVYTGSTLDSSVNTLDSSLELCDQPAHDEIVPTICTSLLPIQSSVNYKLQQIIHNETVCDTTPPSLKLTLTNVHRACQDKANMIFMSQHSNKIAKLPTSSFEPFGNILFHVDGGANVSAVTDKDLFYFFIPIESSIEQVGGDKIICSGWGGILFRTNSMIQVMAPVFFCPSNPRNTFSTTVMTNFCGCSSSIVDTNSTLTLIHHGVSTEFDLLVHNDLDHIDIEIVRFKKLTNVIASGAAPLRRSPRLLMKDSVQSSNPSQTNPDPSPEPLGINNNHPHQASLPSSQKMFDIYHDGKLITQFPQSVMAQIAGFSVLLESDVSPRNKMIKTMNSLLGNYHNSLEQETALLSPMTYESSTNEFPSILVPIIAKFIRAEPRESSPFQDWTKMHLSLLHASSSTMDIMIQCDLLNDIPKSLKKKHRFNCFCHICALRKATKLPRGKLMNKAHLRPFERLHMDFEFFGVESIRGFTAG